MRADALKRIAAEHDRLPETTAALTDLPRVGDYVANATLCFARDEPLPILDRNVEPDLWARLLRPVAGITSQTA